MKKISLAVLLVSIAALFSACGGGGGGGGNGAPDNVKVQGKVFDLATDASIQGARVVVVKADGAAIASAVTDATGQYVLSIPAASSSEPGLKLRVDAQDYQSVPGGIRPSKTLDTTQGVSNDVGLIKLPAGSRGSIAGSVTGDHRDGVLVTGGGSSAISGPDGNFVLYNVNPGSVMVRGYTAGWHFAAATVSVTSGAQTTGATLNPTTAAAGTVSGMISFVNAGTATTTSIALVPRETFNAELGIDGEVPRGLRLTGISKTTGTFTFTGVPAGDYVVIAADENDSLVHVPLEPLPYVTISGEMQTVSDVYVSVTAPLTNPSPGQDVPEMITTGTPVFAWDDDSSEDYYSVSVRNSFGNVIWENPSVPSPSVPGSRLSVTYAELPLAAGFYQFRATSWRMAAPLSVTEEQRGLFYVCGARCP